ncbi:hypothetical protein GCM10019016_067840 [Streptomyces prasinosporus]|uniref:Uncharacterized protein n=1 Tax=Streptomyces prasinosporus TaxID=68256 RepID=A0ABP6TXT3_9ACTN|nr:hypothetical protein GCM10010332_54220 [Streptomyces albogriseolus]
MGERQNDGGRAGRRRVHPERPERPERSECPVGVSAAAGRAVPVSVEGPAGDTTRLEALLVAALVRDRVDAGAEQRAVAAFVAARESGAHGARTRRRDDWRAPRRRFGGRSLRATLGALVAGCALSGVAVAGINAVGTPGGGRSEDTGPSRTPSASSAPRTPDASGSRAAGTPEASASASAGGDGARTGAGRAEATGDAEAHCQAYERVAGRGRALEAPVWERLVAAAGGAERVDAYCAERSGDAPPTASAPVRPSLPPVTGGEAGVGRPTGEAVGTDPSDVVKGQGEDVGGVSGRKP